MLLTKKDYTVLKNLSIKVVKNTKKEVKKKEGKEREREVLEKEEKH